MANTDENGLFQDLDPDTFRELEEIADRGDQFMEDEAWDAAIREFRKGLAKIPEPKFGYEPGVWFYAGIGDAHFAQGEFEKAGAAFQDAWNGDPENPYLCLRLGQCLFELGFQEDSLEYLRRAYRLEGDEIFEFEDPKYLQYLKDQPAG